MTNKGGLISFYTKCLLLQHIQLLMSCQYLILFAGLVFDLRFCLSGIFYVTLSLFQFSNSVEYIDSNCFYET